MVVSNNGFVLYNKHMKVYTGRSARDRTVVGFYNYLSIIAYHH